MEFNPEKSILEIAILEMGRMKGKKSFCPSEVVKWMYPQSWRKFLPDVKAEMMRLYREGKITVTHKDNPVDSDAIPRGSVRIILKSKTS